MRKSKLITLLAVLILLVGYANTASATTEVSAKETREAMFQKVVDGQLDFMAEKMTDTKMGRKVDKMLKKMDKKLGQGNKLDLNSEPDKWLKYALFGWIAGLIFTIVGVFIYPVSFIGWLCWLAGTCLFVYWLLKKLDAI